MTMLPLLRRRVDLLLGGALLTTGCALLEPDALTVVVSTEAVALASAEPAPIQVTATNHGDRTVRWGPGSSTCQLHLLVRLYGQEVYASTPRICTADYTTHRLEPGASRTESFHWAGWVQRGSSPELERLEPGTYELRGAAGQVAVSAPVVFELRYPD
jgi:hypothetical protein